jgi:hypothetical protein
MVSSTIFAYVPTLVCSVPSTELATVLYSKLLRPIVHQSSCKFSFGTCARLYNRNKTKSWKRRKSCPHFDQFDFMALAKLSQVGKK